MGQFQFKTTKAFEAKLEHLAKTMKVSKGAVIKGLVMNAGEKQRGGVASRQEVLELLTQSARWGNVSAMKELRAHYYQESHGEAEGTPLGALHALSKRKAA